MFVIWVGVDNEKWAMVGGREIGVLFIVSARAQTGRATVAAKAQPASGSTAGPAGREAERRRRGKRETDREVLAFGSSLRRRRPQKSIDEALGSGFTGSFLPVNV